MPSPGGFSNPVQVVRKKGNMIAVELSAILENVYTKANI